MYLYWPVEAQHVCMHAGLFHGTECNTKDAVIVCCCGWCASSTDTCIQAHVHSLTRHLYKRLSGMKHSNGAPLCEIFGRHDHPAPEEVQGGIVNFELKDPQGRIVSYKLVEQEAANAGFHIRTGAQTFRFVQHSAFCYELDRAMKNPNTGTRCDLGQCTRIVLHLPMHRNPLRAWHTVIMRVK